ncbi:GTP-binding protein [Bacillus timonensis]|nr:GTP-binding protein [Bacillus timonensis]
MKKVEVYILSGFLGSGKTTLLQNILKQEKERGRKIAVVMNELGEKSIDSDAVNKDTPLKELLNGCVCCTISGQFEAQLQGLLVEHQLDAIYIETTGVAHPIEVLDACMSPIFANKIDVQSIVTIIDANRWQDRSKLTIQMQSLIQEQVRHADVLLINKVDTLTESQQASIVFDIQSVNSKAKALLTTFANVQLKDLKVTTRNPKDSHEKSHVQHDLHLKTYVHEFSKPLDLDTFENWLRNMPDTIFRIKGYLRFTHSKTTYLFQYSYGTPLYMEEMLNPPMTLVFIGEELNRTWMKDEMEKIEEASYV